MFAKEGMDLGIGDLNLNCGFDGTEKNHPLADSNWSAKFCKKDWFAKCSGVDESSNITNVRFQGDRLYYSQHYEEALAKYQQVLAEQHPESVKRDLGENIATCLTHLGRTSEAEDYVSPTLKGQTPEQKSSKLLLQKTIHKKSNALQSEVLVTQRLVSLNPYSYQLWFDLAELYVQVKETQSSRSHFCERHKCHGACDDTKSLITSLSEELNHTSVADVNSSFVNLTERGHNESSGRSSLQKPSGASGHVRNANEQFDTAKSKPLHEQCLLLHCQRCRVSSVDDAVEKTTSHDLLISHCHTSEVFVKSTTMQSVLEPLSNCAKPEPDSSDSSVFGSCVDCKIIACLACSRLCIKSSLHQTASFVRRKLLSLSQQVESELCMLVQGNELVLITQYLLDHLFSTLSPGATLFMSEDDNEDDDEFQLKFERLCFSHICCGLHPLCMQV